MAGLTKAQIAERKAAEEAARQAELDTLRAQLDEATKRAEWYEQMDRQASVDTDMGVMTRPIVPEAPTAVEPDDLVVSDPVALHDPFDSQNPHLILKDPPGFKLGWKNPLYRDGHRGWRGWRAVEHTDEIGRNLSKYLLDPPRRMEHAVDNYVRRGDSILCFIEHEIWEARQQRRSQLAARRAGEHARDMRVDRIRSEADLGPLPVAPGRVGGRVMTS